jgi:hypothetical protein
MPSIAGYSSFAIAAMPYSSFPARSPFPAPPEAVALDYAFDFGATEHVMYVDTWPFPRRVFLLDFWRRGKDGIMRLLGYDRVGSWRDPTHCHYPSLVHYLPHRRFEQRPPGAASPLPGHPAPPDTTRPPVAIAPLPFRLPTVQLEPGVFEIPQALVGMPLSLVVQNSPQHFPKRKILLPIKRPVADLLPVNTPIQKSVVFVPLSAHFQNQTQAEHELSGVLKVMKQFPQLHVTIEGNFANTLVPPTLLGFGPAARADQNARFQSPMETKWPTGIESYNSNAAIMESRAQTIRQYLIRNGISPRRVTAKRGQYTRQRSVTIIFSN